MKRKYDSLQKQILILEKKLFPNKYSYRAFYHDGEAYLQFANDMVYPTALVQSIIRGIKKDTLKTGTQTVGLILELPSQLMKDIKGDTKVKGKRAKKKAKAPKKRKATKKVVKKVKKRKSNGRTKATR